MSGNLTDDQVALLCEIGEIGESHQPDLASDKKGDLERLISGGYAEHRRSAIKLTAKGLAFLSERGAGLNEA